MRYRTGTTRGQRRMVHPPAADFRDTTPLPDLWGTLIRDIPDPRHRKRAWYRWEAQCVQCEAQTLGEGPVGAPVDQEYAMMIERVGRIGARLAGWNLHG